MQPKGDTKKTHRSSKYKSHKKDKKYKHGSKKFDKMSDEHYGDQSYFTPMRYHSGYGMHRPMMSGPHEPMYD